MFPIDVQKQLLKNAKVGYEYVYKRTPSEDELIPFILALYLSDKTGQGAHHFDSILSIAAQLYNNVHGGIDPSMTTYDAITILIKGLQEIQTIADTYRIQCEVAEIEKAAENTPSGGLN